MSRLLPPLLLLMVPLTLTAEPKRPNVLLIMTDDQGFGDLGCHGNPKIRTPTLDRLHAESARFTAFHVSAVCSPTRASLMTGRWNYRTGVVDTYIGRSLMHADETTLAEVLSAAGYRTGIFGKWHLGDNYPLRAMDQGFHEALVIGGGGLSQPADPPGNKGYFDPLLWKNGRITATKGYCTDVFTEAAMTFIEANRDRPWFVYLPYNAPHDPLEVAEEEIKPYRDMKLQPRDFPQHGHPFARGFDAEKTARVYGMVTNIDTNLARLFRKLDDHKLTENTLVIFLSDNGPQHARYNDGLRLRKGSVYQGGLRVPSFWRWPGRIRAGRDIDRIAAHIDVLPTILDACQVPTPKGVALDGRSLWPLLRGDSIDWPERTLFFQWHRGDEPKHDTACTARSQRWKLVQPMPVGKEPVWELYDLQTDPYEEKNLAAEHPDRVEQLRTAYRAWFDDVSRTRGYAPPRIHIGSEHENPSLLTRQDWRGPKAGWSKTSLGYWEVHVARPGRYEFELLFDDPADAAGVRVADLKAESATAVTNRVTLGPLTLKAGDARLEPWLRVQNAERGPRYVWVKRLSD